MDYIKYFKSQAKKLYKDFQTHYIPDGESIYFYSPKYWFDIDDIILSFDIDEADFCLMKAQHVVAFLANFKCWNDLINADMYQLELGYYLVEHRENNMLEKWQHYEAYPELADFDSEAKLDIFKHIFLNDVE